MKDPDFDEACSMLDVVLGAKFYVGNVVQSFLDGSTIKYSESVFDPDCIENSGDTRAVNEYSRLLYPSPLNDRSHLQ